MSSGSVRRRDYEADAYWSERLGASYDLRGTGHLAYSAAYNGWLYRAKRRALRRALRWTTPGSAALDLGSGTGWVVNELLAAGLRVEGCDIAQLAVDRLTARFPAARFFRTSLGSEPLPRENGVYDSVTALDVMYHVTDDGAWSEAVHEAARVLTPGGRLIVSDGLGSEDRMPDSHVRFRSRSRWHDTASTAGLREERIAPYFRWLSRDPDQGAFVRRFPDRLRGATEYALETLAPREPHMRLAVFRRQNSERA